MTKDVKDKSADAKKERPQVDNNNIKKIKHSSKTASKKSLWRITLIVMLYLIWATAAVIAAQLLVGFIMMAILGEEALAEPVWSATYSALAYTLALALIVFALPKVKTSREELGLKGWPTWTDIGLAPIGFIVYLVLAAGIAALFMCFPWFDAGQTQDIGFSLTLSGTDRLIAFITLVVIAPIAEEIIFRGWLYGKLRAKFSERFSNTAGMIISILLVSILFGVIHLQWNVGVNVFALSIVLCGLREITGTVYAGILLHMLKNGVAFYALYVLGIT